MNFELNGFMVIHEQAHVYIYVYIHKIYYIDMHVYIYPYIFIFELDITQLKIKAGSLVDYEKPFPPSER